MKDSNQSLEDSQQRIVLFQSEEKKMTLVLTLVWSKSALDENI